MKVLERFHTCPPKHVSGIEWKPRHMKLEVIAKVTQKFNNDTLLTNRLCVINFQFWFYP